MAHDSEPHALLTFEFTYIFYYFRQTTLYHNCETHRCLLCEKGQKIIYGCIFNAVLPRPRRFKARSLYVEVYVAPMCFKLEMYIFFLNIEISLHSSQ